MIHDPSMQQTSYRWTPYVAEQTNPTINIYYIANSWRDFKISRCSTRDFKISPLYYTANFKFSFFKINLYFGKWYVWRKVIKIYLVNYIRVRNQKMSYKTPKKNWMLIFRDKKIRQRGILIKILYDIFQQKTIYFLVKKQAKYWLSKK